MKEKEIDVLILVYILDSLDFIEIVTGSNICHRQFMGSMENHKPIYWEIIGECPNTREAKDLCA